MKHRKLLTLPLMILLISTGLSADSRVNFHSISLFGFEPISRYENVVTGSGISLAQELYYGSGKLLQIGGGFRYLVPRETEGDEQLSWIPVYAAAKLFLPVESVPIYAKGTAGYCFADGNNAALLNKSDLKGGFYFSLGGGVDLPVYYADLVRFSFVFDMGWSSYSASYSRNGSESSLSYMTMDMLVGMGIRF